ncbi:hypothetical protein RRG08_042960 [Elysia crispata]|uniref:Uncharacterized protein n=1 Tax=Elysia crispata TaxID=231223 RepID=A0AAE1AZ51_9GAST|nr:hypothetical protein RRG08_042960 [Elysia crispata]
MWVVKVAGVWSAYGQERTAQCSSISRKITGPTGLGRHTYPECLWAPSKRLSTSGQGTDPRELPNRGLRGLALQRNGFQLVQSHETLLSRPASPAEAISPGLTDVLYLAELRLQKRSHTRAIKV